MGFYEDLEKQSNNWVIPYFSWVENPNKDDMDSHRFAYECGARWALKELSARVQDVIKKGDAMYDHCLCQDPSIREKRENRLLEEGKDPAAYPSHCDSFGCSSIMELTAPLKTAFNIKEE